MQPNSALGCEHRCFDLLRPRPVLQRLRQMRRLDLCLTGQVGNRTRNLEDAVKGAGAQAHLGHRAFHQPLARVVQLAQLAHLARPHVGVAVETTLLEAFYLARSRGLHPLANGGRRFAAPGGRQLLKVNARYVHVDVNPVHQRPADFLLVAGDHGVGAGAGVGGVAEVAAGTGILGGDEHEVGRIGDGTRGARNGDFARHPFQRLAQDFDEAVAEFRQFIQQQPAKPI